MANPEIEADILKSIDVSGVSEKQTDLKIDKRQQAGTTVKQQNRMTKHTQNKPKVKAKKIEADVFIGEKTSEVIFTSEE